MVVVDIKDKRSKWMRKNHVTVNVRLSDKEQVDVRLKYCISVTGRLEYQFYVSC